MAANSKSGMCPAAAAAAALLEQTARLVDGVNDAAYTHASRAMMNGTIGKHVRHCLDHYAAALMPVADTGASIDYDRRERNVPMETDRLEAIRAIRGLQGELAAVGDGESGRDVTVRVLLTAGGEEAPMRSTLGRELAFASHHAVHHHAMIKVIADELGVPTPDGFGKAPATLDYERAAAAAGGAGFGD